jgi:hypothetical protein
VNKFKAFKYKGLLYYLNKEFKNINIGKVKFIAEFRISVISSLEPI